MTFASIILIPLLVFTVIWATPWRRQRVFCFRFGCAFLPLPAPTKPSIKLDWSVQLAEKTAYRLALLDYRLPCMTGVDLYQHLKRLQPQTQGLLITAYASGEAVQRAAEVGVHRVLPKPVDVAELIPLVQQIIGGEA